MKTYVLMHDLEDRTRNKRDMRKIELQINGDS